MKREFKLEAYEKDGKTLYRRTNEGFSSYELLALLELACFEIKIQVSNIPELQKLVERIIVTEKQGEK